ncbi:MAG: discoidin domain-containing protein [Luteolibacter sp.]
MKPNHIVPCLSALASLLFISCGEKENGTTTSSSSPGGTPGGVPVETEFPKKLIEGTPSPMKVPNLVPVLKEPAKFLVPEGTVLLSAGKTVTGSDSDPFIGSLDLITDGDKNAGEGYSVELMEGLQWVQIDLEKSAEIYAIYIWHFHSQERAYHDVIVQISDDPEFAEGATTVYNNDYDNSAGLGKGSDNPYVESNFGLVVDGRGTKGRYVRLYSNGNTTNALNHYTEVEVFGKGG